MRRMGAKQPKGGKGKYLPYKAARIPKRLADLLEEVAKDEFNTFSDQVREAVRERLIRKGKLPKPTDQP